MNKTHSCPAIFQMWWRYINQTLQYYLWRRKHRELLETFVPVAAEYTQDLFDANKNTHRSQLADFSINLGAYTKCYTMQSDKIKWTWRHRCSQGDANEDDNADWLSLVKRVRSIWSEIGSPSGRATFNGHIQLLLSLLNIFHTHATHKYFYSPCKICVY